MTRTSNSSSLGLTALAFALALPAVGSANGLDQILANTPWQKTLAEEKAAIQKVDAGLADAALVAALSPPVRYDGWFDKYYRYNYNGSGPVEEGRRAVYTANGEDRLRYLGMDTGAGWFNLSEDSQGVEDKMETAREESSNDFERTFDIPEDDQWAAFINEGATPIRALGIAKGQLRTEVTEMKTAANAAKTAIEATIRSVQTFMNTAASRLVQIQNRGIQAWDASGNLLVGNIQPVWPEINDLDIPGTEQKLHERAKVRDGFLYESFYGVKAPLSGVTANPVPPPDQTAAADQTVRNDQTSPTAPVSPRADQTVPVDQTPTGGRVSPTGSSGGLMGIDDTPGTGARADQTVPADQTPTGARVTPGTVRANPQGNTVYQPGYDPNLNNRMQAGSLLQVLLGIQSQLTNANYQNAEWGAVLGVLGAGSVLIGHQSGATAGNTTTLPGTTPGGLPGGDVPADQTNGGTSPRADQPGAAGGQPIDAVRATNQDLASYLSVHSNGTYQQLFADNHRALAKQMNEKVEANIRAMEGFLRGVPEPQKARIQTELTAMRRHYDEVFRPAWLSIEMTPAPVPQAMATAAQNALKTMNEKTAAMARVLSPTA